MIMKEYKYVEVKFEAKGVLFHVAESPVSTPFLPSLPSFEGVAGCLDSAGAGLLGSSLGSGTTEASPEASNTTQLPSLYVIAAPSSLASADSIFGI